MDERAYVSTSVAEGATSYAFDGRGSVTAALDGSGSLAGIAAFGVTGTIEAAAGALPSRGWNAEEADAATGLVYLRARFLMTATLSFASQDTYLGQAANPASQMRYAFAEGDPVNATDPTGHVTFDDLMGMEKDMRYMQQRNNSLFGGPLTPSKSSGQSLASGIASSLINYVSEAMQPLVQKPSYEQQLAAMPAGLERSYMAMVWYKNGWISREAAKKYCDEYDHMGKMAPEPSINPEVKEILNGGSQATSAFLADAQIANASRWYEEAHSTTGSLTTVNQLAKTDKALTFAGKRIVVVQVAVEGVFTIGNVYDALNNPNVTPERAQTDAIVEGAFGAAKMGAQTGSAAVGFFVGAAIGGSVGAVVGAAIGLFGGIAVDSLSSSLRDSGQVYRWKDDLYYAIY